MIQTSRRLLKNNFDLQRFLFAGTVCLVHAYDLSWYKELALIKNYLSSGVAVKAFFVISGFLIFMSYERSSSVFSYATKRLRRIYPGYFIVIILCALGLFSISSENLAGFFSVSWIKYTFANLSFLNFIQHTLPGVFEANKLQVINGALWTLKIEVMFYLSVPLFVLLFKKFNRLAVIISIYALSVAYSIVCMKLAEKTGSDIYMILGRQLPGQLSYFIAGAFFYYYLQFFERHAYHFLICATAILFTKNYWSLPLLEPFALSIFVVFFGLFLYLGNFGKYGDLSYGIYLLHFPIIQCFLHFGWLASEPWLFLTAIVIITVLAAFVMWHLVEKRFLARNSHYVTTSIDMFKKSIPNKKLNTNL